MVDEMMTGMNVREEGFALKVSADQSDQEIPEMVDETKARDDDFRVGVGVSGCRPKSYHNLLVLKYLIVQPHWIVQSIVRRTCRRPRRSPCVSVCQPARLNQV